MKHTRTICDACQQEMPGFVTRRLSVPGPKGNAFSVNLHPREQAMSLGDAEKIVPDICIHCIIDAVNKLDDRPTAAPEK